MEDKFYQYLQDKNIDELQKMLQYANYKQKEIINQVINEKNNCIFGNLDKFKNFIIGDKLNSKFQDRLNINLKINNNHSVDLGKRKNF